MFTAEYYLSLGVPKDKMVLGIATYGRCWTLESLNNTGIYAPAIGPGAPGPYIQIPGTMGFNEVRMVEKNGDGLRSMVVRQRIDR